MGHMGLSGKIEGQPKVGRAPPPPLVRIGLGEGGGAPLSFSLSPSFLLSYSNKGRMSPTPGGSRTPPLVRLLLAGRPLSLYPLYMGAGGTSRKNNN